MNRPLDATTAKAITELFTEVIIAPGPMMRRATLSRPENLRLLITTGLADRHAECLSVRTVAGGFLAQNRDAGAVSAEHLKTVDKPCAGCLRNGGFIVRLAGCQTCEIKCHCLPLKTAQPSALARVR